MRALVLLVVVAAIYPSLSFAQKCEVGTMAGPAEKAINGIRGEIQRGEVLLVNAAVQPGGNRFRDVSAFQKFAAQSYIDFTEIGPRNPQGATNWANVMGAATTGVIARYDSQPRNIRLDPTYQETRDKMSVIFGKASNVRIVRAEPFKGPAEDGCVVHVTYSYQINEPLRSVVETYEGVRLSTNRKGRLLLREDPFNKSWTYVTGDFANADQPDFKTRSVLDILANPALLSPRR